MDIASRYMVCQWHAQLKADLLCTTPENVAKLQQIVRQDLPQFIHVLAERELVTVHVRGLLSWACTVSPLCSLTRRLEIATHLQRVGFGRHDDATSFPELSLVMKARFTVTALI